MKMKQTIIITSRKGEKSNRKKKNNNNGEHVPGTQLIGAEQKGGSALRIIVWEKALLFFSKRREKSKGICGLPGSDEEQDNKGGGGKRLPRNKMAKS